MTKPEQIKTSVDAILEIVEKLKTNIKDNEYIKYHFYFILKFLSFS